MSLRLEELVDVSTFVQGDTQGNVAMGLTTQRITGPRVVLEWVARAWFQPRGGLPLARGRGVDARALENATFGPGDLERVRQALVAEALKTEFVGGARVAVSFSERVVSISGEITLINGRAYPLAVAIGQAGQAIVNFGGTI